MSRFLGGLNREIAHLVDRNPPQTNTFSNSKTGNKDSFVNRNESMSPKEKFVAAKRVEVKSSNSKRMKLQRR